MAKITREELSDSLLNSIQEYKLTSHDGYSKELISSGHFNDLKQAGSYLVTNEVAGKPHFYEEFAYTGWFHLEVMGSSTNWVVQKLFNLNGVTHQFKSFIRCCEEGVWSEWKELVTGSDTNNSRDILKLSPVVYSPNLFINGFFYIDQIGNGADRNFTTDYRRDYVCDGWIVNCLNEANAPKTFVRRLENRIITWALPGFELGQYVTNDVIRNIAGKNVTLSFHIDTEQTLKIKMSHYNGKDGVYSNKHKEFIVSGRNQVISWTFKMDEYYQLVDQERSYFCFEILESTNPEAWFDIYYGKLEINDTVTNCIAKDYIQELLSCQRFYERRYVDTNYTYSSGSYRTFVIRHMVPKYYSEVYYDLSGLEYVSSTGSSLGKVDDISNNRYTFNDHMTIESNNNSSIYAVRGEYIIDSRLW